MYNTKDVFELNQRTCCDLWRISAINQHPSALSPRLIFPAKRDQNTRISEQEARTLYCTNLNTTQYYYSIETPTQDVYQQTGTTPISASSDLSIYVHNGQEFQKMVNIEFKAHNVEFEKIRKDIEKLVKERIEGNWFHTLKNIDNGTLPSLFGKCIAALKSCTPLLSQPEKGEYNDISLIFCFCILEKQWACTKRFFYQSAFQTRQSFEQYVEEFFQLEYSVIKQQITVTEPHGWHFFTPENRGFPETISYKVSEYEADKSFQETIIGVFPNIAHAVAVMCSRCQGQYLQITYRDESQAMVHESRDDVIYEAISESFDKKEPGQSMRITVGGEYAPGKDKFFQIEKIRE